MPRDRSQIAAALLSKGFAVEQKNRDHDYYFLAHEGRTQPVFTKLSRGSGYKSIDDNLLSKISRQLKLTRPQLNALVDCPLSGADYVKILRDQGVLKG